MRMIGGHAFVGKTTRSYDEGGAIEVDHPDYREAQVAGWVTVADVPKTPKGARVRWEGGAGVTIAEEADAHVLVALAGSPGDSARGVVYVAVADLLTASEEPADVPGSGAL
jgi:hypothetical protein